MAKFNMFSMNDAQQQLTMLLNLMAQQSASDLHLSPGYYPTLRIDGRLVPLTDQKILDAPLLEAMASDLLGDERKKRFMERKEADFSYALNQDFRFRTNIYRTRNNFALVFRLIPREIRTLDALGMPENLKIFTRLAQGFVLVVGPNGHGKSTTLAAMIDLINRERAEKIITIEDPIEYMFAPDRSIIDQRELYADTMSFANALRSALRENVNVLMIGEMRDYETISAAVSAAETGHLVFGSLHTNSAAQTVERIIDSFPPGQQAQIIGQLSDTLSGVISQRLIPGIRGGLVPAVEIMVANAAVRNLIRENRVAQLNLAIDTGFDVGMISLNRSLADLVRRQRISLEQAQFYSMNPTELRSLV